MVPSGVEQFVIIINIIITITIAVVIAVVVVGVITTITTITIGTTVVIGRAAASEVRCCLEIGRQRIWPCGHVFARFTVAGCAGRRRVQRTLLPVGTVRALLRVGHPSASRLLPAPPHSTRLATALLLARPRQWTRRGGQQLADDGRRRRVGPHTHTQTHGHPRWRPRPHGTGRRVWGGESAVAELRVEQLHTTGADAAPHAVVENHILAQEGLPVA